MIGEIRLVIQSDRPTKYGNRKRKKSRGRNLLNEEKE
jgi:hypothetical protein